MILSTVLRTVLGRVFNLSSFPPPDQYLFFLASCYHSSMNTVHIPFFSRKSSQPSAGSRACPETHFWPGVPRSRLSTVAYRLLSNRERKSSQKIVSASQFTTCNFLIGKNFNISRSPSPAVAPIPLPAAKLLELSLTSPKSITSNFLIDNLGACILRRPPQLPSAYANRTSASEVFILSAAEGSRPSLQRAVAFSSASFASFASSTSCISNRQIPELESPVSHRKQTIR